MLKIKETIDSKDALVRVSIFMLIRSVGVYICTYPIPRRTPQLQTSIPERSIETPDEDEPNYHNK